MRVIDAIAAQLVEAQERDRPVAHIRVTKSALPGSVVGLPITPERARCIARMLAVPTHGELAVAVPSPDPIERWLEIVIHPDDYVDLALDAREHDCDGELRRVLGIPILREPA